MQSIFTKLIIDKILDNNPSINKAYCLNTKQRKHKCTICQDACPHNSIISTKDEKIDKKTCDDCSLCVALCPTGAISGSLNFMEKAFEILNNTTGKVVLGCSKSEIYNDIKLHCLASYPWELVCAVALNNEIHFSTGDCENCNIYCDYSYMLKSAKDFLGETFEEKIFFSNTPIEYTRMEAFQLMLKKSKNTAYGLVRNVSSVEDFNQIWRKILVHQIKDNTVYWNTPQFNDNCKACNICSQLCPVNALQVIQDEKTNYYMTHFPKKCRGCGLCEKVCPYFGINEITLKKSNNSKAIITLLEAKNCKVCNKLFVSEYDICNDCKP